MATLNIKNVPDDLYDALRKRAEENRRSLNSEVIVSLERVVREQPLEDDFYSRLRRIQESHARLKDVPPTAHDLVDGAVEDGRP